LNDMYAWIDPQQEEMVKSHIPMPTVLTGFGPLKPNLHAPDENISIADYIRGIKDAAHQVCRASRMRALSWKSTGESQAGA
jgi:hypothetical protein